MTLSKEFTFDAAHNLIDYHGKCENLHGHTYRLRVTLKGKPAADGMILDFTILKRIVGEAVIDRLDHHYLNDIVASSTAENTIRWIWMQLKKSLCGPNYCLHELTLWETATSFVSYSGEDEEC